MMKILAAASAGGHWIQLLRLIPAFENEELLFLSTSDKFRDTVKGYEYHSVTNAHRGDKIKLLYMAFEIMKKVYTIKPDVIVTTGAAPGLLAIIAGKYLGAKTIWIDSIANVEKLSLSGKIARHFADRVYTQWPDLIEKNVIFKGNVLS
ncbi:MAG: oligosaccharide biosynthesis protein Alg14 [Pedobacter sp.]|nr:MAG: oligosaccharide biosynthesis protein Alg14 [Pedobacter sp.]